MNWTGGALGRSRNASSSLTAVQKAHFAKARGRLDTTNISRPTFEIFGNISVHAGASIESHNERSSALAASGRRFEENLHRSGLRLKPGQHHGSKRSERSNLEVSSFRSQSPQHLRDTSRRLPIVISSRQSSVSTFKEDGYVSPIRQTKESLREPSKDQQASAPTITEAHRARLLNMRDWVGISHTKPAKIDFTDSNDRDQIGKRRRLSEMKIRSDKPKRRWYGSHSERPRQDFFATNEILSQADISVRIGSAVDRGSARDGGEERPVSKLDHASAVSDEMLLDDRFSNGSVSSHNPFRELHSINQTYHLQQPQNPDLAPSAFIVEPEDVNIEMNNGPASRHGYGTYEVQEDRSHFGQSLPPSRPSDEPVLIVRKPGEESAPIRFVFEDTLPLRDSSSGPKTSTPRERILELERSKADSKRMMFRENEQEPPAVMALTVQNSLTNPKFFDTSPPSHETGDCLGKLNRSSSMSKHLADQFQNDGLLTICHEDHIDVGADAIDNNISRASDLLHANPAILSPRPVSEDEEEAWKRFIDEDPSEQPSRPEALKPAVTPLDKANQSVPEVCSTEREVTKNQAKNPQQTTDEDEALWRSFVFGGEDSNQDWVVEKPEEEEEEAAIADAAPQNKSPTDPAVETQPSMEAEVATSPIKLNAHLVEETASSSPVAKTNGASQVAAVSSTSQVSSDEMLDGGDQNSSSAFNGFSPMREVETAKTNTTNINSPSSNTAQASTSPLITVDPLTGNSIASSLVAQAATPKLPAGLSSDELSWSPARMSQSTAKPTVIFKKPTRYVGERCSDPVEPLRLGRKNRAGRSTRREGKDREAPVKGYAKDEGMWEIGAEREMLEDEIEDD